MKIGYPCINDSIGCTTNSTFRLANYSAKNMEEKIAGNLGCLLAILKFNVIHGIFFFRISSDIIPFASHPVCRFNWQRHFEKELSGIGDFIRVNGIRISMHPDQFVVLNSPRRDVVSSSIRELEYHCAFLDAMGLEKSEKIQIHVGGVYGNRDEAAGRFIKNYHKLADSLRGRLVIENDHNLYSLKDCLALHGRIEIPVLLDVFHHSCLHNGETARDALIAARSTWKKVDGPPMVDFSTQKSGARKGTHSGELDQRHFKKFLYDIRGLESDVMLEIKDREKSAIAALSAAVKFGLK